MFENGTYVGNRYEIIEKIGAGGMSDVYKALDHALGREVALKVLKQEFNEDSSFIAKFRQEAQAAAGLEHANIVNIYDVGNENGMYYIVMEYVEGITLKTYIAKKGRLAFNEVISIAIQVGRGIEAAHKKNIIHRDIKPQNIMISREGKVKVTDFGIARAVTSNTVSADIMGSVHYSSPEQARNGYVSFQSDIYSLGIVMYEMVTGRVPFDGDTTVNIALQHLQSEMTPPSVYADNIPISLEKIIKKATMKNQDRRYQSMEDLLADLKKALVNPDEDFVTLNENDEGDKTRVITDQEVKAIQEKIGLVNVLDEDDDDYDDDDDEYEDDDDDDEINPNMDKAFRIMGIVVAVLIVILVIYFIGTFLGWFKFSAKDKDEEQPTEITEEQIEMVNLLGMTEDEAKTKLKELGLGYKNVGTASSDEYEVGKIMSQSVAAGEKVSANETIKVTVSSGKGQISIPSVVGSPEASAEQTLKDSGFKVNKTYEYSAEVEQGIVMNQNPGANSSGKEGDTITIVVSQGKESVKVPDLTNKTQDEATAALASVKLNVGNITSEKSNNIEAGRVIRQGTAAGGYLDAGSAVDFVISEGKEEALYKFTWTASYDGHVKIVDSTGYVGYDGAVTKGQQITASGLKSSTGQVVFVSSETIKDETTGSETHDSTHDSTQSVTFEKQ